MANSEVRDLKIDLENIINRIVAANNSSSKVTGIEIDIVNYREINGDIGSKLESVKVISSSHD